MRLLKLSLVFILLLCLLIYGVAFRPLREKHPVAVPAPGMLAVAGARIYTSPDAPPIDDGTILIQNGRIVAVGQGIQIPAGDARVPCHSCVVTAGFWNAHVHFTERKWAWADWKSRAVLQAQLQDMLTSRGFTTVVDTGSNLRGTVPLRRRIEHGELAGPKIYTAGAAQYPPNGIPYYLKDSLPRWLVFFMPQPASPAAAEKAEERNIADGADIVKLFTGSYVARGTVLPMPVANALAAVKVAHHNGQLAFAHESNAQGVRVALESGVDVLAHAADTTEGVDDELLKSLVSRHVAMIPTLKMFATTVTTNPAYLDPIYAEVKRFHELGGALIFGTDVGYMGDYTTDGEFEGLMRCGLSGADVLRMLTTVPAARFGVAAETGTLEIGKAGDLTILSGDPLADPHNFARVEATVRGGRLLWQTGGR